MASLDSSMDLDEEIDENDAWSVQRLRCVRLRVRSGHHDPALLPRCHHGVHPAARRCRAVISAYFEEKGLVRQQLDSFNDFINTSLQEIVDENAILTITPQKQHQPGMVSEEEGEEKEYQIRFGQIYLSKPTFVEPDGETVVIFPKEARLRNLTYASPLYVDMEMHVITRHPAVGDAAAVRDPGDGGGEEVEVTKYDKQFLGEVPIMLRSDYCNLAGRSDRDLAELGECPYDQGGYFVINWSEKVLIAQERMANNHVYVFRKSQPSKYAYQAECRCAAGGAAGSAAQHGAAQQGGQGGAA